MNESPDRSLDAAELRRWAEERLKSQRSEAGAQGSPQDTQRLLHELQVHQIELEVQNEELQRARREVDAVLAQYTDLYDFAPVGYFTLARDGTIRHANLAGAGLLAAERSRLVGRRFGLFVSEDSRPAFNAFLEKVFSSRTRETGESALLKEGNQPIQTHIEATLSEDGQECRAVVVDITERKRAEEALRQTEKELEEAQRVAQLGSWVWEGKTDAVTWSDEVYRTFGRDPALPAPRLQEHPQVLTPESWAQLKPTMEKSFQTGTPFLLDLEVVRPDGTRRWIAAHGEAVRDASGQVVKLRGTEHDITERKRAEAQIRSQLDELQRWHRVTLDREDRVQELKREVNELSRRLGEPVRYPSQETAAETANKD